MGRRHSNTYTNWGSGEPNNLGGEEYGHFQVGTHVWNDHQITYTVPFTMQLDKSVANSLSVSCYHKMMEVLM